MAHLNLSLVLLLALVALVPTASLAFYLRLGIDGTLYFTETGNFVEGGPNAGAANAAMNLTCGNTVVASGVTDAKGVYNLSAQVRSDIDSVAAAFNANLCRLSAKFAAADSIALNVTGTLNAPVGVEKAEVTLQAGNFTG